MTAQDYEPSDAGEEELEIEEADLEELEELDLVGDLPAGREERDDQMKPGPSARSGEPPNILEHACKVYAMELVSGEFVRGSGTGRSYLRLWNNEDIDKARVMGTVVQAFLSNDGSYCALTLDDGTETVRVKGWREDAKMMESFRPGQIVDVIGGVREYDGEVYLSPITIADIADPNWEALRELEIYRFRKVKKSDLQL